MGRGKGKASSSNSSLDDTTNHNTSKSSASSQSRPKRDRRSTDLRLGLGIASSSSEDSSSILSREQMQPSDWALNKSFSGNSCIVEEDESDNNATFYVKVYMEGIPIGRKLDLLAHDGYYDMIRTLDYMFNTSIVWSDVEGEQIEGCHVLTYEDKEGDWLMVGDVPWEMFLSSVRRLKITRIEF